MKDYIKLLLYCLLLVLIAFFGFLSWFLEHSTWGLSWGIASTIVLVATIPLTISFAIWERKEQRKEKL